MVGLGKVVIGSIHDWVPDPGPTVSWHPSPAAILHVMQAAGYRLPYHPIELPVPSEY